MEFKLFLYVVIVLSAVFHEYAHALTAYKLGDPTAKESGRLTLNPLAHLDLMGTIIVPLLLLFTSGIFIGWAKPVPYNPANLSDKRYGSLKVGLAGPGANLVIAFTLGIILRFLPYFSLPAPFFAETLGVIVYINIFLALFNLLPFPPLDGSKLVMDAFPSAFQKLLGFGFWGFFFALLVAFWILPTVANLLFFLFVGRSFGF